MKPTPTPAAPPERKETVRDALRRELASGLKTARELSAAAGIREKDVAAHLEHLARSLKAQGASLRVEAASCLACGFAFARRTRLTTPGRCPACGSERIDPPAFGID